ncbi:MAG: MarR family transcriptional regulator [Candidatus Pacebacteria bacterium]|nr:MarR family transcriptional regulator [Candidatus Paceibacterota bacterium]
MSTAIKSKRASSTTDIASLLVSLTRSMYKTMRSVAPACSFLEMKTMTIAYEQKNPSMKYIADELGISSPAVTAIIDRLVESKDVTRYEDVDDRRVTRIELTTQGKKTFEKNRSAIYEAFNQRASVLSDEEQIELTRILSKLQNNQ